jgi:uncharacterized protein (DUF433 family)
LRRDTPREWRAGIKTEAKIIGSGRNPKIAGTRITVYTIWEYVQDGWHPDDIAFWLKLTKDQVEAAIRYNEEHEDEVRAEYATIMERINRGNPPELKEKLDAAHERLQAMVRERRQGNGREGASEGHPGGQ